MSSTLWNDCALVLLEWKNMLALPDAFHGKVAPAAAYQNFRSCMNLAVTDRDAGPRRAAILVAVQIPRRMP